MQISTTAHARWPAKLAIAAAALFTITSSATNAVYGYAKGTDVPTSLIWLAVSIAASIVFALSIPALLRSLAEKKWSQALLVCIGLLTCGTYSVVAALGSATGGRTNASLEEKDRNDKRKTAQKQETDAEAKLAALKPTRTVGELEALVQGSHVCRVIVTNGTRQTVCGPANALVVELARARERDKLQGQIDAARSVHSTTGQTRVVNSDAMALQAYLAAFGWSIEADTLNKALALLAVLVVEFGGGASLAIGMALGSGVRSEVVDRASVQAERTTERPNDAADRPAQNTSIISVIARSPDLNQRPERTAHERVLSALRAKDGVLFGSQGAMGRSFGWSKTRMHEVLRELEAAGRVRLAVSRQGTAVRLVASA